MLDLIRATLELVQAINLNELLIILFYFRFLRQFQTVKFVRSYGLLDILSIPEIIQTISLKYRVHSVIIFHYTYILTQFIALLHNIFKKNHRTRCSC